MSGGQTQGTGLVGNITVSIYAISSATLLKDGLNKLFKLLSYCHRLHYHSQVPTSSYEASIW